MKWVFVLYLLFQVQYDLWADGSVPWQCAYFAVQFGSMAAVAVVEAQRGRHSTFYIVIALIMTLLAINELSWIGNTQSQYNQLHEAPPAFALAIVVMVLFLILLRNSKLWRGVKKSGG